MSEIIDSYVLVRLWCPPDEAEDWETPRYLRMLVKEGAPVSWTLTQDWQEANYFKTDMAARRILQGIDRIKSRIERGWIYEILRVTEEIVEHNKPEQQQGGAA